MININLDNVIHFNIQISNLVIILIYSIVVDYWVKQKIH